MSDYYRLSELSLGDLAERFTMSPPEEKEFAFDYYADVAERIRDQGDDGVALLLSQTGTLDADRLRAVIFALSGLDADDPQINHLLMSYLSDTRPLVVAEAIDGLAHRGVSDAGPKVLQFNEHRDPVVRGSVLRDRRRLYPEQARPLLLSALKDNDFVVRENAADELEELADRSVVPYLRPLLADPHPDVRQAAETAIHNLEDLDDDAGQAGARAG
jgi:HEAT repeat protein